MQLPNCILCVMFFWAFLPRFSHPKNVSLNGRTIRLIPTELPVYVMVVKKNSSGNGTEISGVGYEMIRWLSKYLNFKYTFLNQTVKHHEDSSGGRGGKWYLLNNQADVALSAVTLTPERYRETDFAYPWLMMSYNMLIPFPDTTNNIEAPWEPFQTKVWISLVVSWIVVIASLLIASHLSTTFNQYERYFSNYDRCSEYVMAVFLAQGGVCYPVITSIRLIAGVWCLAAFVLTSIYNTTLISHVTSPNWQPLANSIFDIPRTPGIKILVDEKMGADMIFSKAESGIFRYFGDMLRRDPSLRCTVTDDCVKKVKTGSFVYIQTATSHMYLISNDLKDTRKCSMTMGKDNFLFYYASLALPKHSPYTESFSHGIIRIHETGLVGFWEGSLVKRPDQCLHFRSLAPKKPRLSFKHLTGPFMLLLIGLGLSCLVFIFERKLIFFSKLIRGYNLRDTTDSVNYFQSSKI